MTESAEERWSVLAGGDHFEMGQIDVPEPDSSSDGCGGFEVAWERAPAVVILVMRADAQPYLYIAPDEDDKMRKPLAQRPVTGRLLRAALIEAFATPEWKAANGWEGLPCWAEEG